jgi:hypothetical protein
MNRDGILACASVLTPEGAVRTFTGFRLSELSRIPLMESRG